MLKDRSLILEGGFNFRDLGGLLTKDGRVIKSGIIFRGAALDNLTDQDLEQLNHLPIRTIVDFRTTYERAKNPDKIPNTCINEMHLDVISGNIYSLLDEIKSGQKEPKQFMNDFYLDFAKDPSSITKFTAFFEIIQNKSLHPILFHCTAGKDRTGFASALILSALGVSQETIIDDYLMSNNYVENNYAHLIKINPKFKDLLIVCPEYIQGTFDYIKQAHGSIENYLKKVLNVDIQLMKDLYLETDN